MDRASEIAHAAVNGKPHVRADRRMRRRQWPPARHYIVTEMLFEQAIRETVDNARSHELKAA